MGGSPYPGVPMQDMKDLLARDDRMQQPGHCPDVLYNMMTQCWQNDPNARPSFDQLQTQLEDIIRRKAAVSFFNGLPIFLQ